MKKTKVMLVDDHSVVRMGLKAILDLEKDLKVCGEAENGAEAVELATEIRPDVVVMDLMMPDMDGSETTARLLEASPDSKVLILTTFGTAADLARAMASGATGAVTKNISNAELAEAIRKTAAGEAYFTPETRQALSSESSESELTPRQMEVLDSITRGLSNEDIATQFGLSQTRVKQHLNQIYAKLRAANRAEAVAIALRRHLLGFRPKK